MLYLVGTPIGNMQDLSPRAVEVLSHVDLVACEDTRRTGLLLAHFGISAKLMSYHEHNKASAGSKLISRLNQSLNFFPHAVAANIQSTCIKNCSK